MSHKWILNENPTSTEFFHWDSETEEVRIWTEEHVNTLAEFNKDTRNDLDRRHFAENGELGTHVARIPLSVLSDLTARGITKDAKAFKRWLNDSENFVFRTHPGSV